MERACEINITPIVLHVPCIENVPLQSTINQNDMQEIEIIQIESTHLIFCSMSPLTKCDTIAPNPEINEIHFRHIDPDVHADLWYKEWY